MKTIITKKYFSILASILVISNVYSNIFYIDPINGSNSGDGSSSNPWKTLEYVINNDLIESKSYVTPYNPDDPQLAVKNAGAPIKAGDIIMLYSGMHGDISIVNYINDNAITVMNAAGATPIFKRLHIQAGKNWIFRGIEISSEPYGIYINDKLVFLESHNWQGPVSNIGIENCHIYSTTTPWVDASSWVEKASDGIIIQADSVNTVNNVLENVSMGISMKGNYINAANNTIANFSGDAMRILGSFNIVRKNIIKNCYAVDENHDDGIQAFTTGGIVIDNNIVSQNIILNYENPNQPLLGTLQGITCFDGPLHNWVIENNLVIVNHWHALSFYGITNSKIINNTALDPTPAVTPGPARIKIEDDNAFPSANCVVKNNVTNTISVTSNTTTGNNITLQTLTEYASNFTDYANFDFHLLQTSPLIDAADAIAAPNVDLDDNPRPSGSLPDIGAYEYLFPLSTQQNIKPDDFIVFPNPFSDYVKISGVETNMEIQIFDIQGKLIKQFHSANIPSKIELNYLKSGVYILVATNKNNNNTQKRFLIRYYPKKCVK